MRRHALVLAATPAGQSRSRSATSSGSTRGFSRLTLGITPPRSWPGSPIGTTWSARSAALVRVWNNAAAESFGATLTVELYDRHL
jgi:hypothetical protein